MYLASLLSLAFCLSVYGQLIPNGSPVPRRDKPAVVFLNGYENDCNNSTLASNFGIADQVLQADGRVSLYFNNCAFAGKPPIEILAAEFGKFLGNLKYEDGQPVTTVDVVAYSMGGLVVRSYLSGKQEAPGTFQPPRAVPIRKLIFFATPQFGTGIALGLGVDRQVEELTSGSRFLLDLATWNQDSDDLRGVDALAVIGNGGTGRATTAGFDDGVVALTSGSIGFVQPGKTRIIPFCHTDGGGLISLFALCDFNAKAVAVIRNPGDAQAKLLVSFLNGTDEWKTVGVAAADDPLLSKNGGVIVTARNANDNPAAIASGTAGSKTLAAPSGQAAYSDMVAAGGTTVSVVTTAGTITRGIPLNPGEYRALVVKPGPRIERVYPSAARVYPLSVAPGMFVSIYGDALASRTDSTTSTDLPVQLADVQVMVNSVPALLHYASATQINAVIPESADGLVKLKVQSGAGSHTVNVLVEAAAPAIFTQTGLPDGPASALNSRNNALITSANALRAGDYLVLYLTGLGLTTRRDGLDYANFQPAVTIAGRDCPVSYAGRAPGYKGLDQINCLVPAGLGTNPAARVVVTSGVRSSNAATVALE